MFELPPNNPPKGWKVHDRAIRELGEYVRRTRVLPLNGFTQGPNGITPPPRMRTQRPPFAPNFSIVGNNLFVSFHNGCIKAPQFANTVLPSGVGPASPKYRMRPFRPQINDGGLKDINDTSLGRLPHLPIVNGKNWIVAECLFQYAETKLGKDHSNSANGPQPPPQFPPPLIRQETKGTNQTPPDDHTHHFEIYLSLRNYSLQNPPELKVYNQADPPTSDTETLWLEYIGVIEADGGVPDNTPPTIDGSNSEWYVYDTPRVQPMPYIVDYTGTGATFTYPNDEGATAGDTLPVSEPFPA